MVRRRAFIGRSTIPGEKYFSGAVDLLRMYSYSLRQDKAAYLAGLSGNSGPYVPPTVTPTQSSSSSSSIPAPASSSSAASPTGSASTSTGAANSSSGSALRSLPVADLSSSSSLSAGAFAGIVIGSVAGVIICVTILFYCVCGGRASKVQKLDDQKKKVKLKATIHMKLRWLKCYIGQLTVLFETGKLVS